MDIKIDREELFRNISKVQSIIERRTNMPILSTILLTAKGDQVYIFATDLELGFQQVMSADIINEGSLTISGRKLFEILKESRSPVFHIMEKENNWVFMSDDVARFDLASLPADEYPMFAEPEGVTFIEVKGEEVCGMINKTIYAVSMEDAGFKLSGIFTEKAKDNGNTVFRMVSTDGHRLSMIDKDIPDIDSLELSNGVMIPKKGMSELNKLAGEGGILQIGFKDKNFVAKKEGAVLVVRLLEAKFPDYKAVIPTEERYKVEVNRISLLEAMRKMLILSNERYRAVKISLENDTLELVSTNPDIGEGQENIKIEYKAERLEAGFNPRYFIDTLQSMESEIVEMGFIDGSKPCVLKGNADKGFLGLIMPMRL